MTAIQPDSGTARRPARLLTQNSEMKQIGVWNWSLPAWAGRLADGRTYNTCPSAGICAQACYARSARNCIERKTIVASELRPRDFTSTYYNPNSALPPAHLPPSFI